MQPRVLRRSILLFAALLLGSLWAAGGCRKGASPPNLLLVVLDTTRADALSCYGNPVSTTPRLDALAAQGALFERAFSTDFWTLPSHASLLTGLYPSEHGATSETNHLGEQAVTLAEVLQRRGYATGAFVANPWVGEQRGFGQGFQRFSETWRSDRPAGSSHRLDPGAVEDALAWIDARVKAGEPFFAFLNLNRAHLPYDPDPEVEVRLHPEPRPLARVARLKRVAGMWGYLGGAISLDELDFQILRELYDGEVAMTDALVGRLVDHLAGLGVLDRTVVVVTADHGENVGDHGRIDHLLSMYDSTLHVPLLFRYPPVIRPGERHDGLVSLVDVFPTVLGLLGQGNEETDRRSLLGRERGGGPEASVPYVVAENERPRNGVDLMRREYPGFDASSIDQRLRMIRTGDYKLVWREHDGVELYDLRSDPGEEHDVAALQPEARHRLEALLEAWKAGLAPPPKSAQAASPDAETTRQLRALGYAE